MRPRDRAEAAFREQTSPRVRVRTIASLVRALRNDIWFGASMPGASPSMKRVAERLFVVEARWPSSNLAMAVFLGPAASSASTRCT